MYLPGLCSKQSTNILFEPVIQLNLFAHFLNLYSFLKTLKSEAMDEDEVEETLKKEFIAKQLLHIANLLDLSDEVGR